MGVSAQTMGDKRKAKVLWSLLGGLGTGVERTDILPTRARKEKKKG